MVLAPIISLISGGSSAAGAGDLQGQLEQQHQQSIVKDLWLQLSVL
jgi:hypothetical protein